MKYSLIKDKTFSGEFATVYSIIKEGEDLTQFEKFYKDNVKLFEGEMESIVSRLKVIGHETGARPNYFTPNEGIPGDGVEALFDTPQKNLRLYCIRNGNSLLIIGGGGEKPKGMRTLQESEKLTEENYLLRDISKAITKKLKDKELKIIWDSPVDRYEGNPDIYINK